MPSTRAYRYTLEDAKAQARKSGYLETVCGRRRYFPELGSSNFHIRQAAERMAVNMPIQGTAADVIKLAMVSIDRRMQELGMRSRMILQVHDELIFETPRDEIDDLKAMVIDLMPAALEMAVPLKVELKTGPNWGDLE